jgi:two-component system chemotaxis response regulator CheB
MALRVLVVDDSALMRKHLTTLFQKAGFEVLVARSGQEAVDQVMAAGPEVVTLDINMPEMDGLTALSLIMAARPTPVVMVSSLTTQGAAATLEALAMGAVDYVAKPGGTISLSMEAVADELISKVKTASRARVKKVGNRLVERLRRERDQIRKSTPLRGGRNGDLGLVLIGVSTGGPRTLEEILPELPANFPWPILVAQHMPGGFTAAFAARLDKICQLKVTEVARMEVIEPGNIYLGRGGTDLVVAERAGKFLALAKPESAQVLWHPSVDVLVESALAALPPEQLIGVELTGMGSDGAAAMAKLKEDGGRVIAESEETAVVFGMPKEVIDRGGATLVLAAPKISRQLIRWVA